MVGLALIGAIGGLPSGVAGADSFNPVQLMIKIASVARRHVSLPITVKVTADASVLDTRTAPLRMRVKLARECGGTYSHTPGTVLLDKRMNPQPTTGKPYSAVARGSGKPRAYGVMTVCAFLDEEGDQRTFASDQSIQVDVSKACTRAAARFDRARRRGRTTRPLRHKARRACGPRVKL